jgi:Putative MetA-pathway of phenol degradation
MIRRRGAGAADARALWLALAAILLVALALHATPARAADASIGAPRSLIESLFGTQASPRDEGAAERPLDADRPHFPEAATAVGKGRIVLESGYTFSEKGASYSQSFPEALLRVGVFADWFELRIGQSVLDQDRLGPGGDGSAFGATDLYLGAKVALTEQRGLLPAIAVIPQMTVPTGGRAVTADRVLPGLNVDGAWEVIDDLFNVEFVIATNQVADDIHHAHVEVATGLTGVLHVSRALEVFVEWDAAYPSGSDRPGAGPRHSAVGGLVYFVSKDVVVDLRVGTGLSARAPELLVGAGFAVRY